MENTENTQKNTDKLLSIVVKEEYVIQEDDDQFKQEQNRENKIIPDILQCFKCEIIYGNAQSLLHHLATQHNNNLVTDNSDFPSVFTFEEDSGYQMEETLDYKVLPGSEEREFIPGSNHFECEKCGLKLNSKQGIKSHILHIHYGEKCHIRLLSQLESFICPHCDRVFWEKSRLEKHLSTHRNRMHSDRLFEIEVREESEKTSGSSLVLNKYMRTQVAGVKFKCEQCGAKLKYRDSLIRHQKEVHGRTNRFKCRKCPKTFKRSFSLKKHRETHSKKLFTCRICEKTFKGSIYLKKHERIHIVSQDFECEHCGAKIKYKSSILRHIREVHARANSFKCNHCPKNFKRSSALERHLVVHADKLFRCKRCKKSFKNSFHLKRHERTHVSRKEFTCAICGSKMKRKDSLMRHIKEIHNTKDKFQCSQCPKTFKRTSHLEMHMEMHSNISIPCEVCDKTFKGLLRLKKHMKIHSDLKVFECEKCGLKLKRKQKLRSHILQVHYGKKCHIRLLSQLKPIICLHCDGVFWEKKIFKNHFSRHGCNIKAKSKVNAKGNTFCSKFMIRFLDNE